MLKPSLAFLVAGIVPAMAIPAFPGAEGYGANAVGGRGGDVYHVTNLNASGAGSFAEAIATVPSAGRTIVFDVSGYIRLPSGSNGTRMTTSKVTIAGQTAPGDGVGFYNNFFRISGDDVVIRHLRFRHGKYGSGGDCIDLDSGCLNAILDHVSMQFSTDENMSSFGSPPENLTLQYSLNAWGLESHSCGGLWDQNHATSHHNLWAHNHTRNPKARPNGLLEWVNNVTFDWDIGFIMGDTTSVQNYKANVINNYFVCPPGNTQSKALVKGSVATNGLPNFTVFLGGNLTDNNGDGILNGTDKGYSIVEGSPYSAAENPPAATGAFRYYQAPSAITGSTVGVAADPALVAYKKVVSNAGALRLDANYTGAIRDEVDTILMSKLTTQARFHVSRESDTGASASGFGVLASTAAAVDTDHDGMPDFYESALGWNPAAQDHNTALANSGGLITGTTFFPTGTVAGYTRLEEYLQYLAIPHATVAKNISGTPTSIQMDLRKFTSGFSTTPSFAIAAISNGAITQYLADGVTLSATGPIVKFTPTLNFVGRARFDFTVTDAAGSAWTQTLALLVSQSGLPRDLTWKGDGSANVWDSAANNWVRNGAATAFSFGDRVTLDDGGSQSPAVNVTGAVAPTTVDVNATANYNLGGTGSVTASGALTKRGSGILTFSNSAANGFGSVILDSGTITAGRTDSIGTGNVSIGDATLNLPGGGGTFTNPLAINGSSTLNWTSNSNMYLSSNITGAEQFNLNFSNKLFTLQGSWANFTGTLNTGSSTGTLRINSASSLDFSKTDFQLGNASVRHHLNGAQSVSFGKLNAGAGAFLTGGDTNYAVTDTYTIGALNADSTFAGTIADGSGTGHKLGITKSGTGALTLSGSSTHTGPTAVSAGSLIVSGNLMNSPVTVASGAVLAGGGTLGGGVTASAGAILSPGTAPFTGATMTVSNGLALNGATLYFDMTNSPGGANDRIAMNGGTLALAGSQYFQFLLLQGGLQAGTYDLISGATNSTVNGVTLTHNLPAGSRQTFTLNRTAAGSNPSKVWLDVVGDPGTLTWTGGASAVWDTATAGNWTGASPGTFYPYDAVVFNDSSTVSNISLPSPVSPRSTVVDNTARAYTLAAGLNGGSLVKSGTNSLTLSGANTFGGGLTLSAGTIVLGSEAANGNGLGTGSVTMNAGIISMRDDIATYNDFNANMVVPNGATARLNADGRVDMYGTLAGAGTLNFYVPWVRTTLYTDWSAFTGTINVITDADGGDFRMGTNYGFPGFPNAALNLSDKIYAYHVGTLSGGAGTTIDIGEVSGTSQAHLRGGVTGGRALTYRIGGRNTNATFAGFIEEQNTGTATNFVKIGTGTWTLGGSGLWNGGTAVNQGTLAISGNFTSTGAVNVANGAALVLTNGTLATDAVNLESTANLTGYGTVAADLNCNGKFEGRGFSSGTPGTLNIGGSAFFDAASTIRMRGGISSDLIAINGDLSLAGTVQIALAPGTAFGRYPLFSYGGSLAMDSVSLTGIPGGTTAQLSTSVAGLVSLVIDDSDEDGLPDSWEMQYLGNLSTNGASDPDGDGQNNAIEFLAGTNPNSGTSRFAVTMAPASATQFTLTWPSVPGKSYQILTNSALVGGWSLLTTVPAANSPAATTSYTVTKSPGSRFYRIAIAP
ncbi:MAG: autotransporter-associated beta strand repeat-containing protein [Luteolibacter sp.]|uniref:autotransporter-associated beta strand repeat-containing protein n=1 Tax=Luteolibacter sp. TaxID=1962973 RepID=UPI0032657511